MSGEILRVENLSKYFVIGHTGLINRRPITVKAVDGVSFSIGEGETLGLVGESGSGKSTVAYVAVGMYQPTTGEIHYLGENLFADPKGRALRHKKAVQIVFQDPQSSLNPAFTVFGSLQDPLKTHGVRSREERRKVIGDLLESVNMRREHMDLYPHEFSGGQRQRIGIARALCIEPDLIVCDEAVSALDVSIQAQVLKLLKQIKDERNLTYIFITHDLSVVEYISDRVAVMYLGKIVELADSEELYAHNMHPYTKALLSAIPVADLDTDRKRIILEGDVPSPVDPPSGCPFHPRCPVAKGNCSTDVPALRAFESGEKTHYVACHYAEEQAQ